MPVKTKPSGPIPAEVMIVGEAPGAEEEIRGVPFIGTSGAELTKMLHESGFVRSEIFLTNVCKYRPPMNEIEAFFLDKRMQHPNELIKEGLGELMQEIAVVRPKLIIAMGNTALWALTGQRGITKWRGSMLKHLDALLMPTYHPALILREWAWRSVAVHDLRRAREALSNGQWPEKKKAYRVRPSFPDAMEVLQGLTSDAERREPGNPLPLASDLETRAGYIACHGIAWSNTEAICLPTMCVERPTGYWTLEQELGLWEAERVLLTHPNVSIIGQNYLYDAQYFARRRGYIPRLLDDTLVMQNVAYPGLPKGLDFLSSMYRKHHVYWKDEGKNWDAGQPEEQLWSYNCEDACATFEVAETLQGALRKLNLWEQYRFQMRVWTVALECMLRGVKVNQQLRSKIAQEMMEAIQARESSIEYILGHSFNVRSPKQCHALFYGELNRRVIKDRKTRKPTANFDAMETWAREEPLMRPLIQLISDVRSLGVVLSNAVTAPLDWDGRIRSSFSISMETFRWSSSENAFGGGTNMQNWTKGDEDKEASALRAGEVRIPNIRKMLIPDEGYEIASADLTGADAQTVAWEAGDEELKRVFRENKIKVHAHNAMQVFGEKAPTGYEQPYYDYIRTGVHLVNYGGHAKTLSGALVTSEREAQQFIDYWFRLHPRIQEWHNDVQDRLAKSRSVENKFGYRRLYFDRIQDLLPEALAWIGQSSTACVTNRALVAMREDPELLALDCQILFQVHDEIVFQYPIQNRTAALKHVDQIIHITIPYDDPLVIPWGLKTSRVSWGDCTKAEWPT